MRGLLTIERDLAVHFGTLDDQLASATVYYNDPDATQDQTYDYPVCRIRGDGIGSRQVNLLETGRFFIMVRVRRGAEATLLDGLYDTIINRLRTFPDFAFLPVHPSRTLSFTPMGTEMLIVVEGTWDT